MSDDNAAPQEKRPQGRSPSYPALSLPKAISRAAQLYQQEKQFPTPLDAVVKRWGYSGMTGPASLAVAALKKFGLITDEGSRGDRRVRVTDLAVQILNHPNPDTKQEAIRKAALAPTAHLELWTEYGTDLPGDGNLMWELTQNKKFTDSGARDFLREYRETIDFAGLTGAAAVETSKEVDDYADEGHEEYRDIQGSDSRPLRVPTLSERLANLPARVDGQKTINILMPSGDFVNITGKLPLTEEEWIYLLAVMNVMKPGFTGGTPFA